MAVEWATPETYCPWLVTPVGQVELVVPAAADPEEVPVVPVLPESVPVVVVVVEGTVVLVVESSVVVVVEVLDAVESVGLAEPEEGSVEELDTTVSPEVPEGREMPMS